MIQREIHRCEASGWSLGKILRVFAVLAMLWLVVAAVLIAVAIKLGSS